MGSRSTLKVPSGIEMHSRSTWPPSCFTRLVASATSGTVDVGEPAGGDAVAVFGETREDALEHPVRAHRSFLLLGVPAEELGVKRAGACRIVGVELGVANRVRGGRHGVASLDEHPSVPLLTAFCQEG